MTVTANPMKPGQSAHKPTGEKVRCPHFLHSSIETLYKAFDYLPPNMKLLRLNLQYDRSDSKRLKETRRGHVQEVDMLLNKIRRRVPGG